MGDKILNRLQERDLHSVLNKFCTENLDIRTKTIYHERSIKNKGKSEWLHPDMVGFQLITSSWDNNIIEVCKNFNISKAILYSFELKKSITIDTLREYYFQAVSNSSWANEGYLVTASLDEENLELVSEIKRLVGAFGIGIIKLDILNPKNSSIIFPAKRKDMIDGETMNKLYSINPDYQSYIQIVSKSLQINQVIALEWDNIEDYEKIKKMTDVEEKYLVKEEVASRGLYVKTNVNTDVDDNLEDDFKKVTLDIKNINLTSTKPIKCIVNGEVYKSDTWRSLILSMIMNLRECNDDYFKGYLKRSNILYDTPREHYYVYNNDLNLYVKGVNSNTIYKEMQILLDSFNLDLSKCVLYYKYVDKKK